MRAGPQPPFPRDTAHLALHVAQVGQELVQLLGGHRGWGRGEQRLRDLRGAAGQRVGDAAASPSGPEGARD